MQKTVHPHETYKLALIFALQCSCSGLTWETHLSTNGGFYFSTDHPLHTYDFTGLTGKFDITRIDGDEVTKSPWNPLE